MSESFTIRDRGVAIVGITVDQYELIKPGDRLTLRLPDGSTTSVNVTGVEYPSAVKWVGVRPQNPRFAVLVDAIDVPTGTEVYLPSP